jgi:hypothetical protein
VDLETANAMLSHYAKFFDFSVWPTICMILKMSLFLFVRHFIGSVEISFEGYGHRENVGNVSKCR